MKRQFVIIILFTLVPVTLIAQLKYSNYFKDSALRIDYYLAGSDSAAEVYLGEMKKEPYFGGSKNNLVSFENYGTYRYRVYDLKKGELIYSKGFCPLFQEWQATAEAKELKKSFYQVAVIPFPKDEVVFTIEYQDWSGEFRELFSVNINPKDYFIREERLPDYEIEQIQLSGKPENKVDLVFLSEGYTKFEMNKYVDDVKRMVDAMFEVEPFDMHKDDFNIYAVKVPSMESGTDMPGDGVYRNTAFNSSFYTFDVPRYLTTTDMKSVHDAAALVPYDQILVLTNTDRYGGGGFYNYLSLTSVDHVRSEEVFVHEFGHAFAGLADEYYDSEVAYEEYYNLEVEPWEPNITTLVDFDSKWKDMIDLDTPIPTPRGNKYSKDVGVFEGGGYVAKGIYSPMTNCRMKSIQVESFCPVCQRAIEEMILYYCE